MIDQALLSQIQRHLIEGVNGGASWSSLWTRSEVLNYANQRQQKLLKETHAQMGIAEVAETQDSQVVDLPEDWLATVAVLRINAEDNWSELPLADTHQVDVGFGDTNISAVPKVFVDTESSTLKARVIPAPAVAALLELYYIPLGSVITGDGEQTVLPDEWLICAVKWGVIADMLSKVGRGRDDSRIQWAEMRYQMAAEAIRMTYNGWF